MGMTAAKLDRIVQFQRPLLVDDGLGKVEVWADHGTPVMAARADVSDGEKARAFGIEASLVSRFTIRSTVFSRGLKATDRLIESGRTWNITGIKQTPHGRDLFLEITATARTDA